MHIKNRHLFAKSAFNLFLLLILAGCHLPAKLTPEAPDVPTIYAQLLQTLTPQITIPAEPTPSASTPRPPTSTSFVPTPTVQPENAIWLHPGLSPDLIQKLNVPAGSIFVENSQAAGKKIFLDTINSSDLAGQSVIWVYCATAPFYTLQDSISMSDLMAFWQGNLNLLSGHFREIFVTQSTQEAMQLILGTPDPTVVKVQTQEALSAVALGNQPILVIQPFEALTPAWKILAVDGVKPIDTVFEPLAYPLSMRVWSEAGQGVQGLQLPVSNADPALRTVIVMTGVTALVRATAFQMEIKGVLFPATDIIDWLQTADITHISNEIPFAEDCPYPDPNQSSLIFCSDPEYIELLDYVGTDVVELSGNHMQDWGSEAFNQTLDMYEAQGWHYYAGGRNLIDARAPAKLTHNGNPFAFLGCNPAGPASAWATASQPGTAPCGDYEWLLTEVQKLKSEGIIPIVTFQYVEDYTAYPSSQMVADFKRVADAGAVIVNGSQAHTPKYMTFYGESFIHYGLGNLFFDQMNVYYGETYMPHTRDEFIDRLVFYDGRLISVELLTAILEDYARPRPMTIQERADFLNRIFSEALSE
jgi:hypothetical protein